MANNMVTDSAQCNPNVVAEGEEEGEKLLEVSIAAVADAVVDTLVVIGITEESKRDQRENSLAQSSTNRIGASLMVLYTSMAPRLKGGRMTLLCRPTPLKSKQRLKDLCLQQT